MCFSLGEFSICRKKFEAGESTKEVQDYLMQKYKCKRSSTSNFIKNIRKDMGIYCSSKPNFHA